MVIGEQLKTFTGEFNVAAEQVVFEQITSTEQADVNPIRILASEK